MLFISSTLDFPILENPMGQSSGVSSTNTIPTNQIGEMKWDWDITSQRDFVMSFQQLPVSNTSS